MLLAIVIVFVVGYLAIALEHPLHINKAASALVTGVLCWTLYAVDFERLVPEAQWMAWSSSHASVGETAGHLPSKLEFLLEHQFVHGLSEIAGILFFLMGAMTIVELVDAHEGFSLVTDRIRSRSKISLLWIIGWVTFFLSAVLDNLTSTIVMLSLLRKLIGERETRMLYVGMVVIAANAGGAWTVIGDVTTTMLWVKNKVGVWEVMQALLLPSVVGLLVPLLIASRTMKGKIEPMPIQETADSVSLGIATWHKVLFLFVGLGGLMLVPVFKALTHLPPFMGMLLSLGSLWLLSEWVSHTMDERTRSSTGVLAALKRVDMSSILFFLGILLAVSALGSVQLLQQLAVAMQHGVGNQSLIAVLIGLLSAIVDNVPLVAAGIEMYPEYQPNDSFWMLLAFCAGTGGSCLIIGSAAGVAAMGIEKIEFLWYARRIGWLALAGYAAGVAIYLLQYWLFTVLAPIGVMVRW